MLPDDIRIALEGLVEELGKATVSRALLTLIRDLPAQIATLRAEAEAKDQGEFKRTAHTLKGRCGMLGLQDLRQAAFALEQASQDANAQRRLALLRELEAKNETLLPELTRYQAELAR